MLRIILKVSFLFFIIIMVISCDKTTKPGGNGNEEIVLSDETVIIDETNLSIPDIDSTGTFYSYTFTGDPPVINIDDVIIGQTDYGYLRKVTNVAINGNEIVLQTEQACLTDAIKKCNVKDSIQLTIGKDDKFSGLFCIYLAKGVTVERGGINLDNTTLYSGNVGNVTISATIPEGYVSFEPFLNRELEICLIPPRVEHLLLSAGGILEYDCDLQITASAAIDYDKEILLASFISPPFPIGPVPCFIELSFVTGFETQLDVEGTIKSGFDSEASVEFGAEYNYGNGWDDIWNKYFEFNSHPIEWGLTGDVFARGYITPQLTLKVAGVLGPYMEVEPYLKFDGNVIIPTSWEWELLGGVDGNLGFEVEILSFSLADFNITLLNWETTIASDNGLLECITVTSPNGGETWQMGTSHNITWNDNIYGNVKIELYKSGSYYRTIVSSTSGGYNWSIPTDLTESSSYKVKITSTSNSSIYDYSDNYFTIEDGNQEIINVTNPTSSTIWYQDEDMDVEWNNATGNQIIVMIFKNNIEIGICHDWTANDNICNGWVNPDWGTGNDFKVKVIDTNDNYGWSEEFTIQESNQEIINFTYPNSSTVWVEFQENTYCEWNGATARVEIEIYKGDTYKGIYHGNTENDGHCTRDGALEGWGTGNDFRLKVIDENDNYGWSEEFTIQPGNGLYDDFNSWNTSCWEGNWWSCNINHSAWQPNVSSGFAHMLIDDYSWGQIRTIREWNIGCSFSITLIPFLNSGGSNDDRAFIVLSSNWVQYDSPDAVGVVFEGGNIIAWSQDDGDIETFGSYSIGEEIQITLQWNSDNILTVSNGINSITIIDLLLINSAKLVIASKDSSDGFDLDQVLISE